MDRLETNSDGKVADQGSTTRTQAAEQAAALAKKAIEVAAPCLAAPSTAPCGPAGDCVQPVVAAVITAGAKKAIDASKGAVEGGTVEAYVEKVADCLGLTESSGSNPSS